MSAELFLTTTNFLGRIVEMLKNLGFTQKWVLLDSGCNKMLEVQQLLVRKLTFENMSTTCKPCLLTDPVTAGYYNYAEGHFCF